MELAKIPVANISALVILSSLTGFDCLHGC